MLLCKHISTVQIFHFFFSSNSIKWLCHIEEKSLRCFGELVLMSHKEHNKTTQIKYNVRWRTTISCILCKVTFNFKKVTSTKTNSQLFIPVNIIHKCKLMFFNFTKYLNPFLKTFSSFYCKHNNKDQNNTICLHCYFPCFVLFCW